MLYKLLEEDRKRRQRTGSASGAGTSADVYDPPTGFGGGEFRGSGATRSFGEPTYGLEDVTAPEVFDSDTGQMLAGGQGTRVRTSPPLPAVRQTGPSGQLVPPSSKVTTDLSPKPTEKGNQEVAGGTEYGPGPTRPDTLPPVPGAGPGAKGPLSLDDKVSRLEDAMASGGRMPPGILQFGSNGELTGESQYLLEYWQGLKADALQERLFQQQEAQQQQTFLLQLLQNPGAMASFQLLRGNGAQPFLFGGSPGGFGQGGGASPFGFNPMTPQGAGINPQTAEYQSGINPIGSPVGSFFNQGAVPRLNEMGANPQGQQGLEGLLALFGINPQQLQQASARETPMPFQGGARASFALPAGRR